LEYNNYQPFVKSYFPNPPFRGAIYNNLSDIYRLFRKKFANALFHYRRFTGFVLSI